MAPVTDRDRWLALGLLLIALVVGYLVLVHPWWTAPMLAEEQRITSLQQRELRARMVQGQRVQVDQALAAARDRLAKRPGFLPESNAQLATAGLIKRLETVVAEASPGNRGCAIQNRSPLPGPASDRYTRVAMTVQLRCGMAETGAVLHALESGSPRLFVDNLNLMAQRYFGMVDQAQNQNGGLNVTFDLYGYLQPAPGRPDAPRTGATGAR